VAIEMFRIWTQISWWELSPGNLNVESISVDSRGVTPHNLNVKVMDAYYLGRGACLLLIEIKLTVNSIN